MCSCRAQNCGHGHRDSQTQCLQEELGCPPNCLCITVWRPSLRCRVYRALYTYTELLHLYRAPEQADAEFGTRGNHTDVWGSAACILHLATGLQPYSGLSMLQMVTAMLKRRPPDVPNTLPEWLQQMLKECFSFDTAKRPSVSQSIVLDHWPLTLSQWASSFCTYMSWQLTYKHQPVLCAHRTLWLCCSIQLDTPLTAYICQ